MKAEELILSKDAKRNSWLHRCLPLESWQEGHEETAAIIEKAETSEQVIDMILDSDTMRGTQIYAELSKDRPDHRDRIVRDLTGWYTTYSDAGSLKIGSNGFYVHIPNGFGDGNMRFTDVGKGCLNHNMLNYWTSVEGHEIDVYDYDCTGGSIVKTLDGRFGIYQGYGLVVFERWGEAE